MVRQHGSSTHLPQPPTVPAALSRSTYYPNASVLTLLEGLEDLLVVKGLRQALHGRQALSSVALLHPAPQNKRTSVVGHGEGGPGSCAAVRPETPSKVPPHHARRTCGGLPEPPRGQHCTSPRRRSRWHPCRTPTITRRGLHGDQQEPGQLAPDVNVIRVARGLLLLGDGRFAVGKWVCAGRGRKGRVMRYWPGADRPGSSPAT